MNDTEKAAVKRLQKTAEMLASARTNLLAENAKLHALCRDMYLVVELLDMDRVRLQAHGKDADWRTLKERYDELEAEVTEWSRT